VTPVALALSPPERTRGDIGRQCCFVAVPALLPALLLPVLSGSNRCQAAPCRAATLRSRCQPTGALLTHEAG
jgi:hypothetical protein